MNKGEALAHIYSGIFGYVLTAEEAKLWRINTAGITNQKLELAKNITGKLKSIPFIEAIFVTGSVAVNNAKENADIDLMIITQPGTLWITRFLIAVYLKSKKIYKKIICPNIFLDTNHLEIEDKNLYTAHEVLQAKCLFDRSNIEQLWLAKNKWTRDYLPNAYPNSVIASVAKQSSNVVWLPLELLAYVIQYLFMKRKITNEHVGWGFAFFHPNQMAGKVVKRYNDLVKKFLIFLIIPLLFLIRPVFAEQCDSNCNSTDECQKKIDECNKLYTISVGATKPHEAKVQELETAINNIKNTVDTLSKLIEKNKALIAIQENKLAGQQIKFETKVRDYYIKNYVGPAVNFLEFFLTNGDNADSLRNSIYRQTSINRDKQEITSMVLDIVGLNNSRKKSEENQANLKIQKNNLEITLAPIKKLVDESKKYQSQLSQTAAGLSAKQEQLIAAKIGSLNLSRSAGGPIVCSDDRNIDPGFSPRLAFFTFGIPHRVGMSQYGALGRAKDNKGYEEILSAYFKNYDLTGGFDGKSVKVNGKNEYGQTFSNETMNIEEYLKHLYEMPASWHENALKAQAVAARSYALAVYNAKGFLYPSQSDQVIKKEKNAQSWINAVDATKGKVMTQGGQPIKAWYASTAGGYTFTSQDIWGGATSYTKRFRDTTGDINSTGDLFSKAYDRESPCFYNAQGWRSQYGKSAWLKPEEVADIVNVILLSQKDSGTTKHLAQIDKPNPDGVDTWDANRVRGELGSRAFDKVENVSMELDYGTGRTTKVKVSGGGKDESFDGQTFKDYFNLRAPANLSIVGPMFNIEKK
ncbi:MAG: SpoIID/LytB domain-containing protein [bacterium]|nr:SpoIID/LytB domain-containing protein [bacterium]